MEPAHRGAFGGVPEGLEFLVPGLALGEAGDVELEPFRHAADGAPVRWLHQVG